MCRRASPPFSVLRSAAVVPACAVACLGAGIAPAASASAVHVAGARQHAGRLTVRAASTDHRVSESIAAKLVGHRNASLLSERGRGSGTFSCAVSTQIAITYRTAVVTFTCETSAGLISGRGQTSFYASGPFAHFSGALTIVQARGRYAHAQAVGLTIHGTLSRDDYTLSASVVGQLRY